jgi:hypothetical protein
MGPGFDSPFLGFQRQEDQPGQLGDHGSSVSQLVTVALVTEDDLALTVYSIFQFLSQELVLVFREEIQFCNAEPGDGL